MPFDFPVRIVPKDGRSPLAATIYAQIDALSALHDIEPSEMLALLAFNAFGDLNLDRLQFWIDVVDIGVEKAAATRPATPIAGHHPSEDDSARVAA